MKPYSPDMLSGRWRDLASRTAQDWKLLERKPKSKARRWLWMLSALMIGLLSVSLLVTAAKTPTPTQARKTIHLPGKTHAYLGCCRASYENWYQWHQVCQAFPGTDGCPWMEYAAAIELAYCESCYPLGWPFCSDSFSWCTSSL